MTDEPNRPDEIVTLYYCPGCEMMSLAGDVDFGGHPSDYSGDQLVCDRCSTKLNAESFVDYVDMRVVEYK